MKVKFINKSHPELIQGKIYTVKRVWGDYYSIENEVGVLANYYKHRFEIVKENEMKIDSNKLEAAINSMTSICEKGKTEIKNVLAEGFGVEFTKPKPEVVPEHNQVYKNNKGEYGILIKDTYNYWTFYNFNTAAHEAAATDRLGLPRAEAAVWLKYNNWEFAYESFQEWLAVEKAK